MKKLIILAICLLFTVIYPETGSLVASSCCSIFGIWWLYVHHAVQLLLAMATILIMVFAFKQKPLSKWGFNFNNHTWSLLTVLKFAAGWIVITFLLNLLFTFGNHINYERSFVNVTADLFFDFVLTGISEEILFRGLIMGLLLFYWPGRFKAGNFEISYAAVIATLLFSLAHIGINYRTFTIDHIDGMQIVFTVGLGLFYAIMREKSGSLLGPVLAHGVSDGTITVAQLILY